MSTATLTKINIPQRSLKFILLQRCDLQKIGGEIYRSKFANFAYRFYEKNPALRKLYKWYTSSQLEPLLRGKKITEDYIAMMNEEMELIHSYLPQKPQNILNIGCGVGGLDALLSHHYAGRQVYPHFYLVDKTGISEEIVYDFHDEAANYNSLEITRQLLEANNVMSSHIHTIEASEFARANMPPVDFVISMIAWGFHFPVDVYISRVFELMQKDASLMIDIRRESNGIDVLKKYFGECTVIYEHPRFFRVIARKSQ